MFSSAMVLPNSLLSHVFGSTLKHKMWTRSFVDKNTCLIYFNEFGITEIQIEIQLYLWEYFQRFCNLFTASHFPSNFRSLFLRSSLSAFVIYQILQITFSFSTLFTRFFLYFPLLYSFFSISTPVADRSVPVDLVIIHSLKSSLIV